MKNRLAVLLAAAALLVSVASVALRPACDCNDETNPDPKELPQ